MTMRKQSKLIELYFDARTGAITDDAGRTYTPDQARTITQHQKYRCNLAFARLAENDFDVQTTQNYYCEPAGRA